MPCLIGISGVSHLASAVAIAVFSRFALAAVAALERRAGTPDPRLLDSRSCLAARRLAGSEHYR